MKMNPLNAKDFYKVGHKDQYPKGTEMVYSNFTPRSDRLSNNPNKDGKVVFYGLQGVVKWLLIDLWNEAFFSQPKALVVSRYKRRVDNALGTDLDVSHIEALHDLGYLPICIRALPEGSVVNMKVPVFTIYNTLPEFFWLTNMLETSLSAEMWKSCVTATTAHAYRKLLESYTEKTGGDKDFINWQIHDFSMRGMSGIHDSAQSSSAVLLSFWGTDALPAIDYLEDYYNADSDKEMIGGSVPATEHSVMCMGGHETEIETFRRLITETYPGGVISIVSDTWDFWKVITEYALELKEEILNRQPNAIGLAKVVFRPDSGDPVKIVCGTAHRTCTEENLLPEGSPDYYEYDEDLNKYGKRISEAEAKGAVECLWDIFGGTVNEAGYKVLNERVGLIYGDSITLQRAEEILKQLEAKGFCSSNIVFGVGSYTYQYVTRDTYGFAMKATYGVINGEGIEIFKDPKTDNGTKKSAKGLLRVDKVDGEFVLSDQQTWEAQLGGELKPVFIDGELLRDESLSEIRERLNG